MRRFATCSLLCLTLLVSGCSDLPSWLGGGKRKFEPLPGDRTAVLKGDNTLIADSSLEASGLSISAAEPNTSWPQHGGNAGSSPNHPALATTISVQQTASVGDGNDFEFPLLPPPVMGDNIIFAMDAKGHISAHDAKDISRIYWTTPGVATSDDEPMIGGGLAYAEGRLYAVSGKGMVIAFDASTGNALWRQAINIPIRSAPKVAGNKLFIATADSQLFALERSNGVILWNHRGINEGASFLAGASPSVNEDLVIAPYSSGEIYALSTEDGKESWTDTLNLSRRTAAIGIFTGIGADPVIAGNALYVVSTAGVLAAYRLDNGSRVWEQPVAAINTPWPSGNTLFVLSSDDKLIALNRLDGRVYWTQALPSYKNMDEKKGKFNWSGPVLAGGRLLVAGGHGVMLSISPTDGKVVEEISIPNGVYSAPIIAGGVAYVITQDATLVAVK